MLLAETWRWTDDAALARRLREPALLALEWIDRYGDRDGDGFVEYGRQAEMASPTSPGRTRATRSASTTARSPRRRSLRSRCRDTSTTRSADSRRSHARCGATHALAQRLESEADELRDALRRGVLGEDGGFYALALDGKKRPVDARCSNMGHLLWSGIALPERVGPTADQLLSDGLWSGWGIRTMSTDSAAYNPISYHNGTVWPHDTALAVWGLARHGYAAETRRISRALIEAAGHFDWSLPEVFAGYDRQEAPFPISYPTPTRPQAWAAGTPILLVRLLLGVEPDRTRQRLVSTVTDELPSWLDGLSVEGIARSAARGRLPSSAGMSRLPRVCRCE